LSTCALFWHLQVLLQGGEAQRMAAAWVSSRLASCAAEAKTTAKAVAEFCQALMAAGALAAVMDLLLSKEVQCKAAGVLLALNPLEAV
jgi:negative regulator of genetic competence, sporulation and motility